MPLTRTPKAEQSNESTKKNVFTVDNLTPSLPEDSTLTEIRKVQKTVVNADESQDATVIKKIGEGTTGEKKVNSIKEKMELEPQDATVVKKIGEKLPPKKIVPKAEVPKTEKELAVQKKAEERKASAKKAIESGEKASEEKPVEKLPVKKTPVEHTPVEKTSKAVAETKNYLSMLPDNWSKMHWAQIEKFIKTLTDADFVKFIMTVENKAVIQKACKERLKEIAK